MAVIKTVLRYFDMEPEEYTGLADKLRKLGLDEFDAIRSYGVSVNWREWDGREVELDTKHLFRDQWNTVAGCIPENGYRLFDWRHYRDYDGSLTYRGYWLEQTNEMKAIRRETVQCGYCGRQYTDRRPGEWCTACLGSEYLKESELALLCLVPVCHERHVYMQHYPAHPDDDFVARYREVQRVARRQRAQKRREATLANPRRKIECVEREYGIVQWLIDHHVPCDNVIYYDHSDCLVFGWRHPVSAGDRELIKARMAGFDMCDWSFKQNE